jgi:hypothetical protein
MRNRDACPAPFVARYLLKRLAELTAAMPAFDMHFEFADLATQLLEVL